MSASSSETETSGNEAQALSAHERHLLDEASELRDWSASGWQEKGWRRLRTAVREPKRPLPRLSWAFAAAAVCAIVIALLSLRDRPGRTAKVAEAPAQERVVSLGEDGELYLFGSVAYRMAQEAAASGLDERQVNLQSGKVRAVIQHQRAGRTFAVVTPHARVVVVGTRFEVEALARRTLVSVLEGRVRVEVALGQSVEIGPGEQVASDDDRFSPPPGLDEEASPPVPEAAPRAAASQRELGSCASLRSLAQKRSCLTRVGAGTGVAAQNALFSLGQLESEAGNPARALQHWKAYEHRFPGGLLGPEVRVRVLQQLIADHRYLEALRETQAFLSRHASDRRMGEVALARANLLCKKFGNLQRALDAYGLALGSSSQPTIAEEALFAKGACLDAWGRQSEARETWVGYLRRYPSGPRAEEAGRRLEGR